VLVAGGSSIDILFRSNLPALKLTEADLKPYDAQFWGVLPGQSSIPLGQIMLPMQFDTPNHFRTDYVNFVVADFEGTYHAILGRPALTKIMAVPHYSWCSKCLPSRVSLLSEAMVTLPTCEEESFKVAEATDLSIRMEQTLVDASKIPAGQLEIPERQVPWKHVKSTEHKEIQLVDDVPARQPLSGPS
jgi:hypothetical protein